MILHDKYYINCVECFVGLATLSDIALDLKSNNYWSKFKENSKFEKINSKRRIIIFYILMVGGL